MTGEAHFYSLIRPELRIEAPIGYHSAFDLRRGRSIHLLEDLVETKGATFCNPQHRIYRTQTEEIVSLLATLHGTYYNNPRLDTELGCVVRWSDQYSRMVRGVDLKKYHHRGFDKAADVVPEALTAASRSMAGDHPLHGPARLAATDHRALRCTPWQLVHHGERHHGFAGLAMLCAEALVARSRVCTHATLTIEDRRMWGAT